MFLLSGYPCCALEPDFGLFVAYKLGWIVYMVQICYVAVAENFAEHVGAVHPIVRAQRGGDVVLAYVLKSICVVKLRTTNVHFGDVCCKWHPTARILSAPNVT